MDACSRRNACIVSMKGVSEFVSFIARIVDRSASSYLSRQKTPHEDRIHR
ncbi:hypothetical protein [Lysobacter gummosus]